MWCVGTTKKEAEAITAKDEDLLWERGILGDSSSELLLDTVIWFCGLCFALRGGEELCGLKRYQIKLCEAKPSHPGKLALKYAKIDIDKKIREGRYHISAKHVTTGMYMSSHTHTHTQYMYTCTSHYE